MPMHDWTLVDAGIFHAFHHRWISAISDALNAGILPKTLYALPEQIAAGFGPDVLTLQDDMPAEEDRHDGENGGGVATMAATDPRCKRALDLRTLRKTISITTLATSIPPSQSGTSAGIASSP